MVTHDIEEAVLLGDRILAMGVNPGHIKKGIAIDLSRPRHIDNTLTPAFMQISRQVLGTIREETLKSIVYLFFFYPLPSRAKLWSGF